MIDSRGNTIPLGPFEGEEVIDNDECCKGVETIYDDDLLEACTVVNEPVFEENVYEDGFCKFVSLF